jgi:hypothetical protein
MPNSTKQAHGSDSLAQRAAELNALRELGNELRITFAKKSIALPDGSHVEVDGYAEGPPPILVEVCARLGGMNEGTRKKILADALKLVATRKLLYPDARLMLVLLCDKTREDVYKGWRKAALNALDVEVHKVSVSSTDAQHITAAQMKQRTANAAKT